MPAIARTKLFNTSRLDGSIVSVVNGSRAEGVGAKMENSEGDSGIAVLVNYLYVVNGTNFGVVCGNDVALAPLIAAPFTTTRISALLL